MEAASSGPPVKERFVFGLLLLLSAWCLLNWEEICSLNEMHLAMTALSSLQGLLAVKILCVIRADGIDINISSVGVRCSVHPITDKGGQTSLILRNQVEQKCNTSNKAW